MNAGTVVWLKSGGPMMTTKWQNSENDWICTWFVGNEVKEFEYHPDQLTETNPQPEVASLPLL